MTPEKQQPAVPFRKRLCRCKHTEHPCSLDKCLLVWPASSIKLQRSKAALATSMVTQSLLSRFLLGLVQVAGFNSKREHYNMVEKHRIRFSCVRTLSKSLDKDILISLLWWRVFRFWTVWTGHVYEWANVTCRVLRKALCVAQVVILALFSSHQRLLHQHYNNLLCNNTTPVFSQLEQVKTSVHEILAQAQM